jgi:uncharacterized protein (DUF2147 family)
MTRFLFRSLALAGTISALPAVAAADPLGVWLVPAREAHIQILKCETGEGICGKLLSATKPKSNPDFVDIHNKDPALRTRRMMGQIVMEGFKGGPTKWTGGKVYNPGDGNTYTGILTLVDENHLKLTGCAFWFLCKSQTWTRLE